MALGVIMERTSPSMCMVVTDFMETMVAGTTLGDGAMVVSTDLFGDGEDLDGVVLDGAMAMDGAMEDSTTPGIVHITEDIMVSTTALFMATDMVMLAIIIEVEEIQAITLDDHLVTIETIDQASLTEVAILDRKLDVDLAEQPVEVAM